MDNKKGSKFDNLTPAQHIEFILSDKSISEEEKAEYIRYYIDNNVVRVSHLRAIAYILRIKDLSNANKRKAILLFNGENSLRHLNNIIYSKMSLEEKRQYFKLIINANVEEVTYKDVLLYVINIDKVTLHDREKGMILSLFSNEREAQ